MVRFVYSFVVGMLFLNLQAYAMINDVEPVDPAELRASTARREAVRVIEKVGNWNTFGRDFAEMFRQNKTYFALGVKLDTGVLNTFQAMCGEPSQEELAAFNQIEQELFRIVTRGGDGLEIYPDIARAYLNYLEAEKNYKAQKAERLAEERQRQRRLAEEEDNRRIAALSEKDSFIRNAGKRIASFMKFCPRIAPDFAE